MLYNEPDFVNVKSLLEIMCEARGFQAIFFPKFHCELNFTGRFWCGKFYSCGHCSYSFESYKKFFQQL